MADSKQIEGPGGFGVHGGPGNAGSLPTKHYPASGNLSKGKATEVDSPAPAKPCHK